MPRVKVDNAESEVLRRAAVLRVRWPAAAALAMGLLASPAHAQMPAPTGWDQAAVHNFRSMTRCLANGLPDVSDTFVRSELGSEPWRAARERLVHKAQFCALATGRATSDIWRGAIAEALYVQRHRTPPAILAAADAPPLAPGEGFDLERAADCIVARRLAAVDSLIRTDWKSPAEQAGVETLRGDIGICTGGDRLPPLVTMIRFRLALATALYRRAQAQSGRAS